MQPTRQVVHETQDLEMKKVERFVRLTAFLVARNSRTHVDTYRQVLCTGPIGGTKRQMQL